MFQLHLHTFRAIAITGVVTQHCMDSISWDLENLVHTMLIAAIYEASVWFTFISGFLFQHLSPKFTVAKYYKAKLRNVVAPYLIMSIPALIISTFVIHQDNVPPSFYDLPARERIVAFILTGKHLAPFWYIPVIVLFFIAGPLFIRLDRAKWPYLFLIPLSIVSIWLGRDGFQGLMGGYTFWAPPSKALYLLAPYMFGMFCSRYHDRLLTMTKAEVGGIALIALIAYIVNVDSAYAGASGGPLFVFKMVTCPLVVWGAYRLNDNVAERFGIIATYSFGIYFTHGYLLAFLNRVAPYTVLGAIFEHGGVIAWVALTATVILACCLVLSTAKKYVLGSSSRLVTGV